MIVRSIRILSQPFLKNHSNMKMLQPVRNSSEFTYRTLPPSCPRWTFIVADGLNAFMWWWIFVHLWYQPGHVFGEYDIPTPKKWADAELGVVDEF